MSDTIVFLHAHPDDECILTGATMAKAADAGFRTIAVYGTRGDAGETNADLDGESLGDRRVREAEAACSDLGVARVVWLPYADSGMAGTETTENADAFSNADPKAVAAQIAGELTGEQLSVIVGYDSNGTYGHPDHAQVHHVAHAFGTLDACPWVLDATYNREYLASLPDADGSLDPDFAAAEADLTHFVEGEQWLRRKVEALMHHQSQVPEDWDGGEDAVEGFRARFGTEWFIATPYGHDAPDFAALETVFEPKSRWTAPPPSEPKDQPA